MGHRVKKGASLHQTKKHRSMYFFTGGLSSNEP